MHALSKHMYTCTYTHIFHSLSLSLSGAVYRGMWKEGVKEGEGTFTFKNGETFSGLFHRDHLSQQQENGEEVHRRPRTPLSSLIGESIMGLEFWSFVSIVRAYNITRSSGRRSSGRIRIYTVSGNVPDNHRNAFLRLSTIFLTHCCIHYHVHPCGCSIHVHTCTCTCTCTCISCSKGYMLLCIRLRCCVICIQDSSPAD